MASSILRRSTLSLAQNSKLQIEAVTKRLASSHLGYLQALAYTPATRLDVLDNGLRIASENTDKKCASVGLWIDVGARNELPHQSGIGNLFEHTVFKGTDNCNAATLEKELKSIGAKLDISRTRELTGITATCVSADVPKVVEILADVVQHASFDESEIEKQKAVMLQKLETAEKDDTEGVMHDYLHSVAFQGTPLAQSTYGTTEGISSLTKEDLLDYRRDHLIAPRMVLTAAGGVDQEQLTALAAKHFTDCSGEHSFNRNLPYCRFSGSEVMIRDDDMSMAHILIGVHTCAISDQDFLSLELAKTLMGSWDKTQPGLNSANRLKQRFYAGQAVNSYKFFNTGYRDTGIFGYYLTCKRMQIMDAQETIVDEMMHLCETVSEPELERAKNRLRTDMCSRLESSDAVSRDIGTQIIYNGARTPLAELEKHLDMIDTKSLTDVCDRYIFGACHAQAGLGPIEQMFSYVMQQKFLRGGKIG